MPRSLRLLPLLQRSGLWCSLALLCGIPTADARDSLRLHGTHYQSLGHTAARLGMQHAWATPHKRILLTSQWTQLEFEQHKRYCRLDGIKVHFGYPIALKSRDLYLSQSDYEHALLPILTPQLLKPIPKLYHIVLDPGHGGRDPGGIAPSRKVYEKTLSLDLAQRLRTLLAQRGYRVSLTRHDDTWLPLKDRPAFANRLRADLFISLHFNTSIDKSVHGIETYAYTPRYHPSSGRSKLVAADRVSRPGNKNNAWNALLSFYLQREMLRKTGAVDRGCKRARFAVLQALECPGALIEGGFLSHPREGAAVRTAAYRDKLAQAIALGIYRYQNTLNRLRRP